MNGRERLRAALDRRRPDRLPVFYQGTPEVDAALRARLGLASQEALLTALGQDMRHVGPRYCGPELRTWPDGSREGLWGERYRDVPYGDGLGTYPEASFLPFAEAHSPRDLDGYRFPSADWWDYGAVTADCAALSEYAIYCGGAGQPDFMNGIARCRGVERVLYDVGSEDPVFLRLVEERFAYFYTVTERTLQAGGGRIDVVHCGEDLGTQRGPIISPASFDRLFAGYYRDYFALAHRYGARTMLHSCGSVRAFLPRLIDLGLDILDVVQVAAEGMALDGLQRDFGRDLAFSGTMCVQSVLPFGTVADVERETRWRMERFAEGGLILGPTHAVQVLTPLENVLAMYRTVGSMAGSGQAASGVPGR